MLIHRDVRQNSLDWLELRLGIPTASEIHKLITPKWKIAESQTRDSYMDKLIAEIISGESQDDFFTADTQRGHEDEETARDIYAQHCKEPIEQVAFITEDYDFGRIGFSPDGLVGETGLFEAKSRKGYFQVRLIRTGEIDHAHDVQMQTGLMVSAREYCDYFSYHRSVPHKTIRVTPDYEKQNIIKEAVASLYKDMNEALKQMGITNGLQKD